MNTRCLHDIKYQDQCFSTESPLTAKDRGVKPVGFWRPHCIYEQSCRGPHEVLNLEISTSLGNDLCNVARSKIDLQKKNKKNKKKVITFPASVKLSPNDKNLYLSSVDCDLGFKRLFDDDPLQYCRNSLLVSESSRRPH